MDFETANKIGRRAEQDVSKELRRLAFKYKFRVLNDVLLVNGKQSAQLDHVVIDNYGILIVETKRRKNALILGTDVERTWTACYPQPGGKHSFPNPLGQNRHHEDVLRRLLKVRNLAVSPDYVASVVVFVGANISKLELRAIERLRVTTIEQLETVIRDRSNFVPNPGGWDQGRIDGVHDLLSRLSKTGDLQAQRLHGENVRGPRRPVSKPEEGVPPWKRPESSRDTAGFAGSADYSPWFQRMPPADVPVRQTTLSGRSLTMAVVGGVVVAALLPVLLNQMAMMSADGAAEAVFPQQVRPSVTRQRAVPRRAPQQVTLEQAKSALLKAMPQAYGKVVDLDTPRVTYEGVNSVYEWHEIVRLSSSSATTRTYRLTFDQTGSLTGVTVN